jgi:hypothetical protein
MQDAMEGLSTGTWLLAGLLPLLLLLLLPLAAAATVLPRLC